MAAETLEKASALRIVFVEMLFALTAAEIAVQASELVQAAPITTRFLPAYTQLLLATIIVTSSWVGWLKSKAPGNKRDVDSVFSAPFLVLLLDVFLVVCYYIIVKGVDVTREGDRVVGPDPSADNETLWTAVIFGSYLLWDLLTKAWVGSAPSQKTRLRRRLRAFWLRLRSYKALWKRAWISAACFTVSLVIRVTMGTFTNTLSVVGVDAALICLVFVFRALKEGDQRWAWTFTFLLLVSSVAAETTDRMNRPSPVQAPHVGILGNCRKFAPLMYHNRPFLRLHSSTS